MNLGYFLTVLTLLFIALKLTGHITWSWWLVLLPFYGTALLAAALIISAVMVAVAAVVAAKKGSSK